MTTDKAQFDLINATLSSYEPRREKHQANLRKLKSGERPLDESAYPLELIAVWKSDTTYNPGTVVIHQGSRYLKLDDNDNSEPDSIAGGWEQIT